MACLICLHSTWMWSLWSFTSISEEGINATGFLCQAEEGERGREKVFITYNSETGTLVLIWLSFGGRGELVHFSNVFKVLTCSLLPSFLHFSAWPESGWSFRPLVVLHAHTPSLAERQCGSSLSSCILSWLRGHESILYQHQSVTWWIQPCEVRALKERA